MLRFGAQARSRKRSTGSKGIPVTIKVASRLLSVAAFAYGTSEHNEFDRTFDHRIDIVVILSSMNVVAQRCYWSVKALVVPAVSSNRVDTLGIAFHIGNLQEVLTNRAKRLYYM